MTDGPSPRLAAGARVAAGRRDRGPARGLPLAGAVLLAVGSAAVALGWYGVARTPHLNEQLAYLASGGLGGLALIVTGAVLYLGGWLTALLEQGARVEVALRALDAAVGQRAGSARDGSAAGADAAAPVLVTVGRGRTLHRPDCPALGTAPRRAVGPPPAGAVPCRVCRPGGGHPAPSL